MINNALAALLSVALAAAGAHADDLVEKRLEATPESVVQQVSDDLLVLIDDAQAYVDEDPERFFVQVEALLAPAADFRGFARGVMAAHYKRASEDQRQRFAETFKWGLVRTFSLALTEFKDGQLVLVPDDRPAPNPRRKNVKMEMRTGAGEVFPITFSMKLGKDGAWRLGNIIANGVNIGLTYRSQFASAVQDQKYGGDLDQVIDAWADVLSAEGEAIVGGTVEGS